MAGSSGLDQWQRDVFVIGAGFSRAVSKEMPVTKELFDLCRSAAHDLELEVVDDELVMNAFDRWGGNIETWLTWLGSDQPWLSEPGRLRNRAAFGEVAQALGLAILRAENGVLAAAVVPPWLVDLVRAWANRSVTVITMNYDVLIEKTFEIASASAGAQLYSFKPQSMSGTFRWGGPGPTFRFSLLKLHGSISWYIYPPSESSGSLYGPIYDAELLAEWKPDPEGDVIKRAGARRPLIVPPVLAKDPYFVRPELREQWQLADYALQHAERLFVIGYSLPDADLTMRFLLDRAHPQCAVSVVDADKAVGQRVETLVSPRKTDLTFTGRDSVVPEFVENYVIRRDGLAT